MPPPDKNKTKGQKKKAQRQRDRQLDDMFREMMREERTDTGLFDKPEVIKRTPEQIRAMAIERIEARLPSQETLDDMFREGMNLPPGVEGPAVPPGFVPEGGEIGEAREKSIQAREEFMRQLRSEPLEMLMERVRQMRGEFNIPEEDESFFQGLLRNVGRAVTIPSAMIQGGLDPQGGELDRIKRAFGFGEFRQEDILFPDEVLKNFGMPELGTIPEGIPIIGDIAGGVTGRDLLGFAAAIAIDPLRFLRIGQLNQRGLTAAMESRLAMPQMTVGRLGEARFGSMTAAQALAGQRDLISLRIPFTRSTIGVTGRLAAPVFSTIDGVRAVVGDLIRPGAATFRGRDVFRRMAEQATFRGAVRDVEFRTAVDDLWERAEKLARENNIPLDVAQDQIVMGAEFGRQATELARKTGVDSLSRKHIKQAKQGYLDQGFTPRESAAAARLSTMIPEIDPIMAPFAAEFMDLFRGVIRDEEALGLVIGRLSDPALHYVSRVLTPEARELLLSSGRKYKKFERTFNDWWAKHGATKKRRAMFEGQVIPEINRVMRQQFPKFKGEFFETNPVVIAASRGRQLGKAVRSGDFFESALNHFSRPANETLRQAGWVPLEELMTEAGLRAVRPTAAGEVATRLGGAVGRVVPPEVADMLRGATQRWKDPRTPSAVMASYDSLTKAFKWMNTVPFPAFHTRNALSNVWANYLGDVIDPRVYGTAAGIMVDMRNVVKGNTRGKVWEFRDGRSMTTKEIMDIMESNNALGFGQFSAEELGRSLTSPLRALQKLGSDIESHAKIAHFVDKINKGWSTEQALLSVKKYLFDYSDLSPFEKTVLRRAVPFYTWTRKNLPLQLEMMATKPGKFTPLVAFQEAMSSRETANGPIDTTIVPRWMTRRMFAIRPTGDGKDLKLIGTMGVGSEDLALLDMETKDFLSMLNPLIKVPAQLATDRDFFTELPLDVRDVAPSWWRHFRHIPGGQSFLDAISYKEVFDAKNEVKWWRANPRILQLYGVMPTGRLSSTTGALFTDVRRPDAPDLQTLLETGVRVSKLAPIDQARNNMKAFADDIVERLEDLQSKGVVRESGGRFSVLESALLRGDPEIKRAEELRRLLGRMRKVQKRLRQAGEMRPSK